MSKSKVSKSKWFVVTFYLAVLCALAAPRPIMADEEDQTTKLTFSEPVEVPGQVLPAGTYWFTLANSDMNRHIVQIWNANRTQLVTTISCDSRLPAATQGKNGNPFRGAALGPAGSHSIMVLPGLQLWRRVCISQRAGNPACYSDQPAGSLNGQRAGT